MSFAGGQRLILEEEAVKTSAHLKMHRKIEDSHAYYSCTPSLLPFAFIGMSDGAGAPLKWTEQISLHDFPHHLQTLGTEVPARQGQLLRIAAFRDELMLQSEINPQKRRKQKALHRRWNCFDNGSLLKKREPSDEHFATSFIGQILRINIERAICMGCPVSPCIN